MTAFRATFSDMKLVKTRQVAQLIFEIPIEEFDAAYEVLGGMPVPAKERWFGIAAIDLTPAAKETKQIDPTSAPATPRHDPKSAGAKPEKRDWRNVQPAAQAGIRCSEPMFLAFLTERKGYRTANSDEAAEAVRSFCGVHSRVELGTRHAARMLWKQLDDEFQAWKVLERA